MRFSLAALLEGAVAPHVAGDIEVSGMNADSRAVGPGEAFFAMPGTAVHGNTFARGAVQRGATVVITDQGLSEPTGLPVIVVGDVRAAYAKAAARTLQPQPRVAAGVTGTNGKTSTVSFVRQIWAAQGFKAASLGTLGIDRGDRVEPGALTTPDALSLHRSLHALKQDGFDHVALEASSHGLDQRRLDGVAFDAVAFTSLSRDHLDYHADMEAYRDAKLRLFAELMREGGTAVLNADDPEHMPFMFAALDRGATPMTVGREGAWFEIGEIVREGFGQRVTGRLVGEPAGFLLPLTGEFQVLNALVAAALAAATGVAPAAAIAALEGLKGARGRLELVAEHNGAAVFVDYSHTPDSLRKGLEALRPYAEGELAVVFGCGGDRDRGKRPEMGRAAAELADKVIVTDDNPRTETPAAIRAEILGAVPGGEEIGDRAEAIRTAVGRLKPGDVLLVAGKGHEDYQIVGTAKTPFSDHDVVAAAVAG